MRIHGDRGGNSRRCAGAVARDGERTLPAPLEIPDQGTSLEGIEKELVQMALKQTRGNQTRAARLLDISRDPSATASRNFRSPKTSIQPQTPRPRTRPCARPISELV
ncbi:MAG: hypothetical protein O7E51_08900 [Acidobacteria bacterium]|nr:hypothetical protein [Acidobacteriota bacterium]